MTEPARKTLGREGRSADRQSREEETDLGGILLERWIERPDGQMEQLLVPLIKQGVAPALIVEVISPQDAASGAWTSTTKCGTISGRGCASTCW